MIGFVLTTMAVTGLVFLSAWMLTQMRINIGLERRRRDVGQEGEDY